MKVTLLTTVNSRSAGGLFYSVKYLAKYLMKESIDISITSFSNEYSNEDISTYGEIPMNIYHISQLPILKNLGYSKDINDVLKDLSPKIIHQQGIWMYHSNANLNYRRKNNAISIVTPRGMLDPWLRKNSPFVKKIIGMCFENTNLHTADCLHALCQSEMKSMRDLGLNNPIAVIPNGIEITSWERNPNKVLGRKRLLYLGRLDSKKGVDIFLKAVSNLIAKDSATLNRWKITIAGWGDQNYINKLKHIVSKGNLKDDIEFLGSQYGDEKIQLLKDSDAFILPSHSEGLPMAVLEAWGYGLPVVMTDYCNLPEGFTNQAAHRIDTNVDEMESQLKEFFALSQNDLNVMGQNGKDLVGRQFSWAKIADDTAALYKWLLTGGEVPDFVHMQN